MFDLARRMLKWNPFERITANEALSHDLFQSYSSNSSDSRQRKRKRKRNMGGVYDEDMDEIGWGEEEEEGGVDDDASDDDDDDDDDGNLSMDAFV